MRMSERLRTPTGRPASSMTGAALKPRSVSSAIASWTEALALIDTGLGVISCSAVSAASVRRVIGGFLSGLMEVSFAREVHGRSVCPVRCLLANRVLEEQGYGRVFQDAGG